MEAPNWNLELCDESAFPVSRSETSPPFGEMACLPVFQAKSVNLSATLDKPLRPI